ncbi:uncharacterized protein LY89DRAFT_742756 [Mollisia scopiformis]|uniref:Uncharacterized protein n=1 Tax=Mollisia scopiformis TaxID=149040 RepID=A0A132B537_MOLSC|nr:uncharacterized protein LY89DRAFT_742756 [Mollisia scopiformis]KUJ07526.1 hypothetical protein LY89DRAFT_742756 [Mollisia scopiformis]
MAPILIVKDLLSRRAISKALHIFLGIFITLVILGILGVIVYLFCVHYLPTIFLNFAARKAKKEVQKQVKKQVSKQVQKHAQKRAEKHQREADGAAGAGV